MWKVSAGGAPRIRVVALCLIYIIGGKKCENSQALNITEEYYAFNVKYGSRYSEFFILLP